MKWGNVSHHYWCCHIYYYILYNEKADEKPKKKPNRTVATLATVPTTAIISLVACTNFRYKIIQRFTDNSHLVCTTFGHTTTWGFTTRGFT